MTARPTVIVLAPMPPSATGNGLAMRLDLLVRAVALHFDVLLVVNPVRGRPVVEAPTVTGGDRLELAPADPGDASVLIGLVADPAHRVLLAAFEPVEQCFVGQSPCADPASIFDPPLVGDSQLDSPYPPWFVGPLTIERGRHE